MRYYLAAFCPCHEGGFSVSFADVPEAITQGVDIEEAVFMAQDALRVSLEMYSEEGREFPAASTPSEARAKTEALYAELGIAPAGEVIYSLIAAPDVDTTPVRVSISMPKNVLAALDRKAKRAGLTRSGYIASVAMA